MGHLAELFPKEHLERCPLLFLILSFRDPFCARLIRLTDRCLEYSVVLGVQALLSSVVVLVESRIVEGSSRIPPACLCPRKILVIGRSCPGVSSRRLGCPVVLGSVDQQIGLVEFCSA